MKIYCFKDLLSTFKNELLFTCANNALAIRTAKQVVRGKNEVAANVADFQLFCLGDFNVESGEIQPKLEHVINCVDLVEENGN